jgi:hypothetical protein
MSAEATVGSWLVAISALSSAKSAMRLVGRVGWSYRKILNSKGAVTAPWGTSAFYWFWRRGG